MHPSTRPPAHPHLAPPDPHGPDSAGWMDGFREQPVVRGQVVSRPGGRRDEILIVRSGRLRVHLCDEQRELTLLFLEPGDVFSTHTPAWVTAAEPGVLAAMPTKQFATRLAQASPAVMSIMRVLGRLLARTIELVENLVFREVHERLARLLALWVREQGRHVEASGHWVTSLPFTLTDLALMIGASRQTVSAAFADLERRGLLRRQGRRTLHVLDLPQLEAQGQLAMSSSRQTRPAPPA
ncbi:CRP-like cAMP-binding protein [Sphaerotilus hippei]|uniref:CRP-like cAMP-binding protein n=2 Tax=Sphaerotilus hippei TaxID=744406 RepID=A0A318H6T6_9BURK|nr:CRP-like cAMP-binding protein [Sphaerotilus hippei]